MTTDPTLVPLDLSNLVHLPAPASTQKVELKPGLVIPYGKDVVWRVVSVGDLYVQFVVKHKPTGAKVKMKLDRAQVEFALEAALAATEHEQLVAALPPKEGA